jgi:hypothetical protein
MTQTTADEDLAREIHVRLERLVAARRAAFLRHALRRILRPYAYLLAFAVGCAVALVAFVVTTRPIALGFVGAFTLVTIGASRRALGFGLTVAALVGVVFGTGLALGS